MVQYLDNGNIVVTKFSVDNKDANKDYLEYALSVSLALLDINCLGFIQNMNSENKDKQNYSMSIEKYVESLSSYIETIEDVHLSWDTVESSIVIYISCSENRFIKSTFSDEEFMEKLYKVKGSMFDMNINIDTIDRNDYYWFAHL